MAFCNTKEPKYFHVVYCYWQSKTPLYPKTLSEIAVSSSCMNQLCYGGISYTAEEDRADIMKANEKSATLWLCEWKVWTNGKQKFCPYFPCMTFDHLTSITQPHSIVIVGVKGKMNWDRRIRVSLWGYDQKKTYRGILGYMRSYIKCLELHIQNGFEEIIMLRASTKNNG